MPITAELFDGTRLEFPDGTDPSVIQETAQRLTFERAPQQSNLKAAFESGVESYLSPTQTALESLTGSPEEAAKRGLKRQEAAQQKYEGPSLEGIQKEYQEKGLLAATKKAIGQIPEAVAAQVPQIGAMGVGATLGGIGGGALGSAVGPAGTVAGAAAGAKFGQMVGQALAEFPQFFGSDIERQAQEQIAQGKPVDINRMKAAGAAAGQTALDIFETQMLFGSSTVGKLLGFTPKQLANTSAEAVEKMAKRSILETAVRGTAKGAIAEIPNEIAQQMLERAQAGLSLTTPDALHEYGQTAYQVGLLAPLGMVGSFGERGAARKEIAARGISPTEEPPEQPPATPIVQPNLPTNQPVTQAGVAPIAPVIPKIPEIQTTPTGMAVPAPPAPAAPVVPAAVAPVQQPKPPATPVGISAGNTSDQNRDRSSPASVAQMQGIAARPMYAFVGPSNTISGSGAPIVTGPTEIPESQRGFRVETKSEDGTNIPVQYAVVEAKDLLPSHNADGSANKNYGKDHSGLRAVVGNGRTAGLQEAYNKGTAQDYRAAMIKDVGHGIDPKVIEGMKEPVLVRFADPAAIPSNIGDLSNTSGTLNLSALEQAQNDAGRVDLAGLGFDDNGNITPNTIRQFIAAMPTSEQANLIDKDGSPTRQAHDRLNAAIFHKAYGNNDLTTLAHQSEDPEARNILRALSEAAPQMAQIDGAGAYDIRENVAQATQLAVNARRNGIKLEDLVKQADMTVSPRTMQFLGLFADNPRSPKNISEALKNLATNIANEVNRPTEGLFGAEPKKSIEQLVYEATKPKKPEADLFTAPPAAEEPNSGPKSGTTVNEDLDKVYELAGKSKQAIHNELLKIKNVPQLAEWAVKNAPNPVAKIIAQKVNQRIQEFVKENVRMDFKILDGSARAKNKWSGLTRSGYGQAHILLRGLDSNGLADRFTGTNYSTVLHELIHAATVIQTNILERTQKIRFGIQDQAIKDLKSLLTKVRKEVKGLDLDYNTGKRTNLADHEYHVLQQSSEMTKDIDELLAWGLTDAKYQKFLSEIKVGKKNGFSILIDAVRKLLGLNTSYESALERLMSLTEKLMEPTGQDIYAGIKGKPMGTVSTPSFRTEQTESPAFKRWFGDSKVVNEDGSPKVMYHGTVNFEGNAFRPSKKINRAGNPDGYYFTSDPQDAAGYVHDLKYVADRLKNPEKYDKNEPIPYEQGAELIPVYLSIKNPFVKGSKVTPEMLRVYKEEVIKNNPQLGERAKEYAEDKAEIMKEYGSSGNSYAPGIFPNISFPTDAMQRVLEAGGYDGFKDGDRHWIAFKPNQIKSAIGNTGEFNPESEIITYQNKTPDNLTKLGTTPKAGKAVADVARGVFNNIQNDDYRTGLRVAWVDKNSGLTKDLASQPVFDMNGQLRADMLARVQDQMTNLISVGLQSGTPTVNSDGTLGIDRSENNLARSQILADKIDGKVFKDGKALSGRQAVAEVARALRGKDILREDKARNAKGVMQLAQARALTQELKRLQKEKEGKLPVKTMREYLNAIKYLRKEGYLNKNLKREYQVTPAMIKWAEEQVKNVPEIKNVLDIWRNVNNSLVTLWEETGLFTKEQADEYRSKENYVPLFKSREDLENGVHGGYGGTGTKTVKGVKKLGGSEEVRNLWENMDRHYASMIAAAYQNQTRKVATGQLKALGAAEIVANDNPDVNLRYRDPTSEFADDKGIVSAIVYNPNTLAAFQMMHYELGPILKAFSWSTRMLRTGALVNPMYWIKQLIRDPIHATLVANSGIVTPFHALGDYINILRKDSPEAQILAERGVIGQVDSTIDIHDFLKTAGQERTKKGVLDKAIHRIMQMHEASDAATRVSIYKKQFKAAKEKGMTDEQATNFAVHKSRESINFASRGNSPTLNAIRHMIPFVSAQITSLDTVYRAMSAKHLSGTEREEARRAFRNMAMTMTMMSLAYAWMYSGDDDYNKLPDTVKDNNWLIPNPFKEHTFIKIPIPFEVGYLFKTIPEAGARYLMGNSTGREVLKSYALGLENNLPGGAIGGGTGIPQALKPIVETTTNYSFFTGRPIEGMSDQGKPVEFRGDKASEFARLMSHYGLKNVGLSPAKIDHLIQGYTAELGTFTTGVVSSAIETAEGKLPPAKNIEEEPFFKSFMTNPNSSKAVADFYDLDHKAGELYTQFNTLKKTGQGAEARELLSDEQQKKLIAVAPALRRIQTQMTNIHAAINQIKMNERMSPEARRDKINQLEFQLDRAARQGYKIAESAGINR